MTELAPLIPFAMLAITVGHIIYSRATTDARIGGMGREIDELRAENKAREEEHKTLHEKVHELELRIVKGERKP